LRSTVGGFPRSPPTPNSAGGGGKGIRMSTFVSGQLLEGDITQVCGVYDRDKLKR
jgi:hypothetical protein